MRNSTELPEPSTSAARPSALSYIIKAKIAAPTSSTQDLDVNITDVNILDLVMVPVVLLTRKDVSRRSELLETTDANIFLINLETLAVRAIASPEINAVVKGSVTPPTDQGSWILLILCSGLGLVATCVVISIKCTGTEMDL